MKLFSPLSIIILAVLIALGIFAFYKYREFNPNQNSSTISETQAAASAPVAATPIVPPPLVGATIETSAGIGNEPTTSPEANKGDAAFLATLVPETAPTGPGIKTTLLNVPLFKQQYQNSCEEASLRMVLAYYGIMTDDMSIVQKVGYDPKVWDYTNNIWDNPYKMFVGYINTPNGYGTYAPAIAAAANAFGRSAQSYMMVTAPFIAQQIASGYPVIFWGFFRTPPYVKYNWTTPDGTAIQGYRGEHVRVITGVVGDPSNPTGFYVNDPLADTKNQYWSATRLMTHMNMWGALTNQVVVVK